MDQRQYQSEIDDQVEIEKNGAGFAHVDPNELNEGPDIPPPNLKAAWRWLVALFRR